MLTNFYGMFLNTTYDYCLQPCDRREWEITLNQWIIGILNKPRKVCNCKYFYSCNFVGFYFITKIHIVSE